MGLVSSKRGYVNWGKKHGLNQQKVQSLIKKCEKELGTDLKSNTVYYPNQRQKIHQSGERFSKFINWYKQKLTNN